MREFRENFKPLPIGVDDFKEITDKEYYYIDKTLLIKELLDLRGKVNLFTRPRRFGKTLNLSMLRYFFEDTGSQKLNGENKKLFHGLKIMNAGGEYTGHMCQYPVISLTLKSAKQGSFEMAYSSMTEVIASEFKRHEGILASDKISDAHKRQISQNKRRDGYKE